MARDRAFRSNSFGISATIAFAFVMPNSRYFIIYKASPL
ncbi:hypothetical protein LEP1GSC024_0949 [Leptospira noguchii str. 2001034031]|uniref:Uncharacterized protein n=1 Tax=Leptospira noguchii str. 2001034031 TaxID=1193053 RepID=M6YD28_9LEPT|nr:hypothetical protein LEP1GSC024_0949 [Leptospira noguchii str. 2001034031]